MAKARLRRSGADLTIIAYGTMAHLALEAAERLEAEGVDAAVLDLRSIRPLDWPSIDAAVRSNGKVLSVHEDTQFAGFGAEIAAQIAEKSLDWLDAPVHRYCAPEVPAFPYSDILEAMVMPSVDGIVALVRRNWPPTDLRHRLTPQWSTGSVPPAAMTALPLQPSPPRPSSGVTMWPRAFPVWLSAPDGHLVVAVDDDDVAIGMSRATLLSPTEVVAPGRQGSRRTGDAVVSPDRWAAH